MNGESSATADFVNIIGPLQAPTTLGSAFSQSTDSADTDDDARGSAELLAAMNEYQTRTYGK